jgi:CheY-like chemotaxis protein
MARVLLIDDDRDILWSLRMVLEAAGHEVHELTGTSQLVAAVKRANPDVIVLDVIFPEDPQAGFKAARTLRQTPELRAIPVIMLSAVNQRSGLGFDFSEDDISDDFLPVEAFVEKPIEPKALLALLDRVVGG